MKLYKLYKVINTQTDEVVRYREANSKRQASSGKTTQEKVILCKNEKQYKKFIEDCYVLLSSFS